MNVKDYKKLISKKSARVEKSMKVGKCSEFMIQRDFFREICYYRNIRDYIFSIPNGGFWNKKEAYFLKLSGVLPGVPDIFVAIPVSGNHGLFLECKSDTGKLSVLQKKRISDFMNIGYSCSVFRTSEEGIEILKKYLEVDNLNDF